EKRTRRSLRRLFKSLLALNALYLAGSVVQIISGLLMVTMAMLFLVQPIWLAAIVSFLGCLTTMLGVFQLYDLTKNADAVEKISRDAIERALKSQN
ncbi:MAG: hypothetical protein LC662_05920, partial [Rhodothermaceae bacterium]|nr:hypothetical protein [Rhodothermaceae bacterium]